MCQGIYTAHYVCIPWVHTVNHLICPTQQTGDEKLYLPPCIMAYLVETLVRCACTHTHTHTHARTNACTTHIFVLTVSVYIESRYVQHLSKSPFHCYTHTYHLTLPLHPPTPLSHLRKPSQPTIQSQDMWVHQSSTHR